MKKITIVSLLLFPLIVSAQQQESERDLGNKEYIIVKDYKPVLAESVKISDLPDGDTATVIALPQSYDFESRKAEIRYEAASIKAVKIKDEPLPKLYRCYLKGGGGNYSKYIGELYVNSLRSKKGSLGLAAKHLSGSPSFTDFGNAAYSNNLGRIDGNYFLNHATITGDVFYKRDAVHYYGYNTTDTIIDDEDSRQRFTDIGAQAAIASTFLDSSHVNYRGGIAYSDLTDDFGVKESQLIIDGAIAKRFKETTLGMDLSLAFFNKSDATFQELSLNSNLDRNILRFRPYVAFNRERIRFKGGVGVEAETNLDAAVHVFPRLELHVPVSEGVLRFFVKLDGQIEKNNYHTVTAENPFVNPSVVFRNTIHLVDFNGGLQARLSDAVSLIGFIGYTKFKDLQFFVNDTVRINNFDVLYDDASRFQLHAELLFRATEKLGVSFLLDQFSYKTDVQQYAWYRPNTVATLKADYNLHDKILVNVALFGYGQRYSLELYSNGNQVINKMKPYLDANLGFEYRYSKILSVFLNFNNVGMAKYQQWYGFPMERFNMMGGVTYSF